MGPYVAGKQETGWLYKQTKELSTQGAVVTYSGDNPVLYRLILTIDNDASKFEKYLPTDVADNIGNLKAPFRKEVPQNSFNVSCQI